MATTFLKKFATHTEYNTYINGNSVLPNVSLCADKNEVHFNSLGRWANEYLTFVALTNGTISFDYLDTLPTAKARYMEYSTDNGETWTRTNNVDNQNVTITVNVSQGDSILWRGDNDTLGVYESSEDDYYGSFFSSTCDFDAKGNIMSLLYSDNFKNQVTLETSGSFNSLFNNYVEERTCKIVNAKYLVLPATTLSISCYGYMFFECTTLVTAPVLPATTLEISCYDYMFYDCSSLNYIKAMFTTIPSSSYTSNWVSGVAASGTFVKNSAASWNVTGVNGIPSGWTVQTASA